MPVSTAIMSQELNYKQINQKDKFIILLKYTYWQDGEMWLGYLEEYPDYMTQGENMKELLKNLKDIYQELSRITDAKVRII